MFSVARTLRASKALPMRNATVSPPDSPDSRNVYDHKTYFSIRIDSAEDDALDAHPIRQLQTRDYHRYRSRYYLVSLTVSIGQIQPSLISVRS